MTHDEQVDYFARLAFDLDKATSDFLCAALDDARYHLAANERPAIALACSRLARCLSILDHRRKNAA